MSIGALGPEAHEALAVAMNRLGGQSNSGEGGGSQALRHREEFAHQAGGLGALASPHYLMNADVVQIKVAQGAKPGEGASCPETR